MLNKIQKVKSLFSILFLAWFSFLTIPWIPCLSSFQLRTPDVLKDYQIIKQNIYGNRNDLCVVKYTKKHLKFPAFGRDIEVARASIPSQYFSYNLSTQTLHTSYYSFNSVTRAPPPTTI
jgi:hypothetical protein